MNNEDLYETEMSLEDLEAISGGLEEDQMELIRCRVHVVKNRLAEGKLPWLEGLSKEQIMSRWSWTPEQRAYAEQIWDEA